MTRCYICNKTWTGLGRCHCTGCHESFNSIGAFDRHRRNFKCINPKDLGMIQDEKQIWASPMPEKWLKNLKKRVA
jgi:hypothetical protein